MFKTIAKSARSFSTTTVTPSGQTINVPTKLFINGQWCDSKSGKTFDKINPGTGQLTTKIASAGVEDIDYAVQSAEAAFEIWSTLPPFVRSQMMHKFADKVDQHMEELATLESEDMGKPFANAMGDMGFCSLILRYYASIAQQIEGRVSVRDSWGMFNNQIAYERKEPVGVCGLITPWNFPALMTILKIAPSLAAGCTSVSKLPELAPLSSLRLIELWHEVDGVFPGILNGVPGIGIEAGEAVSNHPGIRKISFTGSTETGKRIMSASAQSMKRVTLELGGKSPLIVFGDADVDKAVEKALQHGFSNSGQFCGAPTRLVVEENVYDEFVEKMVAGANSFKSGYWREEGTDKGPMVSENQMNKVLGYIKKGKEEGAELLCGGNRVERDGYFVEPTLFGNVDQNSTIAQEEIFGPVLSIIKFNSGEGAVDEAISIGNNSQYGLVGAVFTKDQSKAARVTQKLKAGTIDVNNYFSAFTDCPIGGYKMSGIGRELGPGNVNNFLESKMVVLDQN